MAEFFRFNKIKKTRKDFRCFACGDIIPKGSNAYAWVSKDNGTVDTSRLHDKCGKMVEAHCFGCGYCADDGFMENFIYESHLNDCTCEPVNSIFGCKTYDN